MGACLFCPSEDVEERGNQQVEQDNQEEKKGEELEPLGTSQLRETSYVLGEREGPEISW